MVDSAVDALHARTDGTTASRFSVHVSRGGRLTGGHPVPDAPEVVRRPDERAMHIWRDTGHSEVVPRYSDSGMMPPEKSSYEYWTTLPTRYGAGLVRNTRASACDAVPWMTKPNA